MYIHNLSMISWKDTKDMDACVSLLHSAKEIPRWHFIDPASPDPTLHLLYIYIYLREKLGQEAENTRATTAFHNRPHLLTYNHTHIAEALGEKLHMLGGQSVAL